MGEVSRDLLYKGMTRDVALMVVYSFFVGHDEFCKSLIKRSFFSLEQK